MTDREERLRRARRRHRRNQIFALVVVLLVLAALALFVASLLHSCAAKTPAETAAVQTNAQTNEPAQTNVPAQTGPAGTGASPETTASPQTGEAPETTPPETAAPTEAPTEPQDESWKLILVNASHPLPEGYSVTLKELRNGHRVDERIYPELQQMFDDARAAGVYPYINESYRTTERQQQILDKYVAGYEAEGMSHDEAVAAALERVALPGTSEHELGLALDIIAEYADDSTATWQWLKDNCWRYGFILRYPEDKTGITGITYEPWHFRYVGVEAAKEITERGICLEEYLGA